MTGAAFYCMSSEVYFLGAVGLVNSLRLLGHTEPIYVLDCGLRPAHRQLLEPHVTMVDAPGDEPPHLLKTVAPRAHPADVQVLIDADMIAVRRLDPLLDRAAGGEVVAVKDRLDRFVAEWGELLDLGPIERRPYVSSGLVLLGGALGAEVLELWDDRMRRVEYELSYFERDMRDYPLRFVDQDVLNAVIAARVDAGRAHVLDRALAPSQPFRGLRVVDEATLRCRGRDGTDPYVLHHYLRKPWLEPMYHGIYSRMLARLLLADDVAVRVPGDEVPRRMRGGFRARVERARVNAQDLARWYLRDVIPEWIGARLVKLRRPPGG